MTFSRSPRVLKGAFIQFDEQTPQGRIIEFQYNPNKIHRRLEARKQKFFVWNVKNAISAIRSPKETITFTITLDAADNLEQPDIHPDEVEAGIYPSMSAIEMLLHQQSSDNNRRSILGIKWPVPTKKRPLTLFVWGNKRVLPVLVTDLHINEEMFDPALNPVRANIEVTMIVLSATDLPRFYKAYEYEKFHLTTKSVMAKAAYKTAQIDDLVKF